jgi:NTP pyrophosphatase (non-canonical NTP hydrolase)
MHMEDYQKLAITTAIYPKEFPLQGVVYTSLGLCGEAGEVAEKVKKYIRDGGDAEHFKANISAELGDVLWYIANLANELNIDLSQIASDNIRKLQVRKERNTLRGSGDNR